MKIEVGKFYKTRDGRTVGPMVFTDKGERAVFFTAPGFHEDQWYAPGNPNHRGQFANTLSDGESYDDIVSEWHEGPVKTITRKEIVTGDYKGVIIEEANGRVVRLKISHVMFTACDLREAASLFNTVAEALEENAKGGANDGWIEWSWTEEKPYPETLETKVLVKDSDGRCPPTPASVEFWQSSSGMESSWKSLDRKSYITHYRVVKP